MSSLYWRPKQPEPPARGGWPITVKAIMVPRYWDNSADGTLSYPDPVTLTERDIPFLEGVLAATSFSEVRDAMQQLIDGIRQRREIEIWVE